jgi:hypothetical protein
MTGQLIVSGIQLWQGFSLYSLGSVVIVIFLWVFTFLQFVPLHKSIGPNQICSNIPNRLVKKNWIRTGLWSLLFLWTLSQYL